MRKDKFESDRGDNKKKKTNGSNHVFLDIFKKHEKVKHGYFIDKDVAKALEQIRQSALYVDENNDPSENFTEEDATLIIKKVNGHHESIMHAEWLNGRIGSKALFK